MIQLPSNLQAQIGEAVSVIADSDFPERWEDLVPVSIILPLSERVLIMIEPLFPLVGN